MKRIVGIVLLAVSPHANATVVTGGYINVDRLVDPRGTFSLTGDGFQLDGYFGAAGGHYTVGKVGETFSSLDYFRTSGLDLNGGVATVFGAGYTVSTPVGWGGASFAGFSWLSASADDHNPFVFHSGVTTYTQAFTFGGQLCGYASGSSNHELPCDADFPDLSGVGVAEYEYREEIGPQGQTLFFPRSVTFTFGNPVGVPEPGTLGLMGLGLLGMLIRRRK